MRFAITIFLFIIGISLGLIASPALRAEEPKQITIENSQSIEPGPREKASPKDRIPENDVFVYDDRVIIKLKSPQWSRFTNTNSMDPLFDTEAHVIQLVPRSADELQVGDIISYESSYGIIIHRIVSLGQDDEGWYAITKGDNNPSRDPAKVRFSQVKRVVVGIIY